MQSIFATMWLRISEKMAVCAEQRRQTLYLFWSHIIAARLGNHNAMVNPSSSNDIKGNADLSETQAELLQSVLAEPSYPWLPGEVADDYAKELEAAGQSLEISDEAAMQGWQRLSAQLDQIWSGTEVNALALLQQKFAARLPEKVLTQISDRAQNLTQQPTKDMPGTAQPIMAQMIACVKDTVANIAEADLRVIARPMAFSMRSSGAEEWVDATAASVRQAKWENLSAIEQARLSLAAARYAIAQINDQQSDNQH